MNYVLEVLKKCGEHKLYVIMDPHQDVWSRFSGGSGAPYWTFLAVGMDPKFFDITEAAIVHNTSGLGEAFPKMIWSTNYDKMAAATMFILFFAGRHFAPKAILNGQNIQDVICLTLNKSSLRLTKILVSANTFHRLDDLPCTTDT